MATTYACVGFGFFFHAFADYEYIPEEANWQTITRAVLFVCHGPGAFECCAGSCSVCCLSVGAAMVLPAVLPCLVQGGAQDVVQGGYRGAQRCICDDGTNIVVAWNWKSGLPGLATGCRCFPLHIPVRDGGRLQWKITYFPLCASWRSYES